MQAQAARCAAPMEIGFRAGHDVKGLGHLEVSFPIANVSAYYIELRLGRCCHIKPCRQFKQYKLVIVGYIRSSSGAARIIIVVYHQ